VGRGPAARASRVLRPGLALVLACGGSEPGSPPPVERLADCQRYSEPEFRDYCLVSLSSRPAARLADCSALSEGADRCRLGWAASPADSREVPREEHLVACGEVTDCALAVLDARPDADIVAQLAACRAHTGPHARDCTVHALQRWAATGPDRASFDAVARQADFPVAVGEILGLVVACQGIGGCDGLAPATRAACARAVEVDVPERPEICELER